VRRELITVFVAMSTMIVVAFLLPLALSARSTASDRALDHARAETAAVVPVIAAGDLAAVEDEVARVNAGGRVAATVVMPDGIVVGAPVNDRERMEAVQVDGISTSTDLDGGHELVTAVAMADGERAVVRVFVPDDELRRGVVPAWLILGGLGLTLVLIAVALADRMAQRVIRPAEELGLAAEALGRGDFDATVEPAGPTELAATATAFNSLAGRVRSMIDDERAMVSELTHRLRTPVTRLRIDLDRVADPELAAKLQRDVDALTLEVNDLIVRAQRRAEPPDPVDITDLARERFEFWSALAADEQRDCAFRSDGSVLVTVEPDDLVAAVDVLIENVFAHTPRGTRFAVSVEERTVTVDDAGPGFDPALLEAGRSGTGSTGLGLAIVERLADTTGGRVEIGTSPLGGARVACRFGPSNRLDPDP
jgi:signal transduction histidine kinase